MILGNEVDASTCQALQTIFPGDDFIEDQKFTLLHQIVLGLKPLDLEAQLADSPKSVIDQGDAAGRTALWWAIRRADYTSTFLLISYGANINKRSFSGSTSILLALESKNQAIIRLLLKHNCDMAAAPSGWLPLHYCAFFGSDLDILQTVLARGVDINSAAASSVKTTALIQAAQEGHPGICSYLLTHGADSNRVDQDGHCALHVAIQNNSHEALSCLLENHSDYTIKTKAGETLLHYAAQFGDMDCLRTLHTHDLMALSTEHRVTSHSHNQRFKDMKGLTALQVAGRRDDVTPEWQAMFRELIDGIQCPERKALRNSTDTDVDHFYNAPEYLNPRRS